MRIRMIRIFTRCTRRTHDSLHWAGYEGMTQHEALISLFHSHQNVLTTADFAENRQLSCEYRRCLVDLRRKGYAYTCEPIKRNLFRYTLVREPQTWKVESNGQEVWA